MPLRAKVNHKILTLNKTTTDILSSLAVPDFEVKYDLFDNKNIGLTEYSSSGYTMRLNPNLLALGGQSYIDEVVPHEYAHLVVKRCYPKGSKLLPSGEWVEIEPHGEEYRDVCETLGIKYIAESELF